MILVLVLVLPAMSQDKPPTPAGPTVGGTIFANYSCTTTGVAGNGFNAFEMERAYLTVRAPMGDDWKAQITTDVFRKSPQDANTYYRGLSVRMKFAYLDYAPLKGISIKMGLVPGIWFPVEDVLWKYRGVQTTPSDKYSYLSTADIGVSASYALPEKLGEASVFYYNGEGYALPDTNRFKDIAGRLVLTPFSSNEALKSLTIGAFGLAGGSGVATAKTKTRYGVIASYAYSIASIGGEYITREDSYNRANNLVGDSAVIAGAALSVFGEIKAPFEPRLSVLWRYDMSDPNTSLSNDATTSILGGIVWKATEKIIFSLDYQKATGESKFLKNPNKTLIDTDEKIFVHTIVNF